MEEKIKVEVDLKSIYPDGTNYRKEYLKLLKKSVAKEGELHHILPKSMFPKWKKRKSNIVKLSYEDHFKAHYLLYKIYDNYEMTIALFLMLKITGKDNNLKLYKEIKEKQIRKSFKAIYCVEDDRIFDSILEAQTVYNSSISYALKKFSNTSNSKHFCYLEDKNKIIEYLNKNRNKSKNKKRVYCLEENKEYESITNAAKINNLTSTKIIKSCKGLKNTCGNKHWCYLEDKEKALKYWKINGTKRIEINKRIYCFEKNKEYISITEATIENNLKSNESISSICRNKYFQRTANKLHWCYLEDKEKALKYWKRFLN